MTDPDRLPDHMPARLPAHLLWRSVAGGGALCLAVVGAAGCSREQDRPAAEHAVEFVEQFYADVLSGDTTQCAKFTEQGRDAFLAAMSPAATCEEAVAVLGNMTGGHVEEHMASHVYSVETQTLEMVVVRADFGGYADLMTTHWIDGEWRVGPTERTTSTQPVPPAQPEGPPTSEDLHDHAH